MAKQRPLTKSQQAVLAKIEQQRKLGYSLTGFERTTGKRPTGKRLVDAVRRLATAGVVEIVHSEIDYNSVTERTRSGWARNVIVVTLLVRVNNYGLKARSFYHFSSPTRTNKQRWVWTSRAVYTSPPITDAGLQL